MHTPFFPVWRARLAPLGRHVRDLRQHSLLHLDLLLGPLLPPGLLAQTDEGANSRERVFTVRRTFFAFLYQALNPGCPCREVLRQIQALLTLQRGGRVGQGTSAYCQARHRLPWDILPRLRCAAAAQAEKAASLWRGLRVKVIDGSSTSLPDTWKNQQAYPQPGGQKPGCGFPILKFVGVFSLASGALLDYAKGNKHQHELTLLQKLLDPFKAGDLALADRGFSTYSLMALFLRRGVHSLFRLHQARPADLRQGQRLGKGDRLFLWPKPTPWQRPRYLPEKLWKLLAPELSVRILRFVLAVPGFRVRPVTLVTTLLDAQAYPAEELARLYARRWHIELWFRHLKTSMGMEVLRCQSPKLVHKELEMFFIAYNLIRGLMAEAGATHAVPLERLSFKGTMDGVRQFSAAIVQARSRKKQRQLIAQLLEIIAQDQVPDRPGRRQPRAVKRRPKPFALLNRPRGQFKEITHRHCNWKNKAKKP
jgi:hypothetical protein